MRSAPSRATKAARQRALARLLATVGAIVISLIVGALALSPADAQPAAVVAPDDVPAPAANRAPAQRTESARPGGLTSDGAEPVPPGFTVMRFHNRSAIRGLDWLELAVPFMLAERVEQGASMRPGYDRWVIPQAPVRVRTPAPTPADIATRARAAGVTWVVAGWFDGRREALTLGLQLWRVAEAEAEADADAALVAETSASGPVEEVMRLSGEASQTLLGPVLGAPLSEATRAAIAAPASADFYAFTLFGRGLNEIAGAVGGAAAVGYRMRRAERQLARTVLIDPGMPEAQRILGEVKRALNQRDDARGRLEAALRLRPSYVAAMASRAEMAERDREYSRALALHRAVLAARPWDTKRRFALGRLLWDQGLLSEARATLVRVVAGTAKDHPDHLPARRLLVQIHARQGEYGALLVELEAIIELDPEDAGARFDLAAVYVSVGRISEAEAIYDAVATSPRIRVSLRAQAHKFLGDQARAAGDLPAALDRYQRALAIAPQEPRYYFLVATLHLIAGDHDAAQRVLRRALRFPASMAEAHAALGTIAYRTGRHSEAVWHLRRSVYKEPKNSTYRYDLALALSALGDPQSALVEVRAGRRLNPEHVGLSYLSGVVMLRLGKFAQARTWFEATLRLDPDHVDARHNLGRLDADQPVP